MKRITVDEVREAYRVTGLVPVNGNFVQRTMDGRNCGCPAVAVYLLRHPEDSFEHLYSGDEVEDGEEDGEPVYYKRDAEEIIGNEYEYQYLSGFIHGVDGGPLASVANVGNATHDRIMGWEDGVAVREALFTTQQ